MKKSIIDTEISKTEYKPGRFYGYFEYWCEFFYPFHYTLSKIMGPKIEEYTKKPKFLNEDNKSFSKLLGKVMIIFPRNLFEDSSVIIETWIDRMIKKNILYSDCTIFVLPLSISESSTNTGTINHYSSPLDKLIFDLNLHYSELKKLKLFYILPKYVHRNYGDFFESSNYVWESPKNQNSDDIYYIPFNINSRSIVNKNVLYSFNLPYINNIEISTLIDLKKKLKIPIFFNLNKLISSCSEDEISQQINSINTSISKVHAYLEKFIDANQYVGYVIDYFNVHLLLEANKHDCSIKSNGKIFDVFLKKEMLITPNDFIVYIEP